MLPILATMTLGGLEVSKIVSRQSELQTAASEATAVVLARPPKEASDRATLESIIEILDRARRGKRDDAPAVSLRHRNDLALDPVGLRDDRGRIGIHHYPDERYLHPHLDFVWCRRPDQLPSDAKGTDLMNRPLHHLARDESGSTIIEFAVLAPAVIAMLFGVFQVGLGMQAQNALRSIASETARYAVVEYQKGNEISDEAIEDWAEARGEGAPYLLQASFEATITEVASPRVFGTFEKTLTLTYTPPAVVPLVNWASPTLTFSRPIFLIDE
ncbi:pilus assembly protein [Altererythrobacter sp. BO-6]|nr:pilus assembly protein [Altererythrobacter sp. BO-6]